jgi:S-formylglutathione hydrolase FrmB
VAPNSLAAELTALGVALTAAIALGALWDRSARPYRFVLRGLVLLLCVAGAAATGLVWLNRQVDAYPTWASLAESGRPAVTEEPAGVPRQPREGGGHVETFTVEGRASGLTLTMYAYLPAGYRPGDTRRYPVIEALHGYPASPLQWLNALDVVTVLDREIAAGRMAPTIVLFPYQTPKPSLDTECTNMAGGPQAETFLTEDVPAFARARLPVRTEPGAWGLIGYSAGGFCASSLLLRHPGQYAAAASLSGYAEPGIAVGDGSEHTTYDLAWRLRNLPVPAVSLYLACARTDRAAMSEATELAGLATAPLTVTTAFAEAGGHNAQTWAASAPPAFAWLSARLARPVP